MHVIHHTCALSPKESTITRRISDDSVVLITRDEGASTLPTIIIQRANYCPYCGCSLDEFDGAEVPAEPNHVCPGQMQLPIILE